jgi:hypothetical protein
MMSRRIERLSAGYSETFDSLAEIKKRLEAPDYAVSLLLIGEGIQDLSGAPLPGEAPLTERKGFPVMLATTAYVARRVTAQLTLRPQIAIKPGAWLVGLGGLLGQTTIGVNVEGEGAFVITKNPIYPGIWVQSSIMAGP